jgi:hypothetical protein
VTPKSSLAFAVMVIVPASVAPLAGAVIDTVGGVESAPVRIRRFTGAAGATGPCADINTDCADVTAMPMEIAIVPTKNMRMQATAGPDVCGADEPAGNKTDATAAALMRSDVEFPTRRLATPLSNGIDSALGRIATLAAPRRRS